MAKGQDDRRREERDEEKEKREESRGERLQREVRERKQEDHGAEVHKPKPSESSGGASGPGGG